MSVTPPIRLIRSFVRRENKLSPKQQQLFNTLWPRYGLNIAAGLIDPIISFQSQAPLVLEIGFGKGQTLLQQAQANPDKNYLGIEVYRTGINALFTQLAEAPLNNLKIFAEDATDVIPHCIAEQSLSLIQVFFPDPWPKTRHHKRRLMQAAFIQLLHQKMKPNAQLHIATDCEAYAKQMLQLLEATTHWQNNTAPQQFSPRPSDRPLSYFEQRGLALNHQVFNLCFTRNK